MIQLLLVGFMAFAAEDLSPAVQAVLDDPDLQEYFHTNKPGRVPLVVSTGTIGGELKLKKFGKPVVFKRPTQLDGAFIAFDKFECIADTCKYKFGYPVEGVRGAGTVKKSADGKWKIDSSQLLEH